MDTKNIIVDDIWAEQLVCNGHVQRMDEKRLPQIIQRTDTYWKKEN
jgi:hypothetical protein